MSRYGQHGVLFIDTGRECTMDLGSHCLAAQHEPCIRVAAWVCPLLETLGGVWRAEEGGDNACARNLNA